MNSNLKGVLIFVSGLGLGAAGMYLGLKKTFELKADTEIAEVKSVYEEKLNEIERENGNINSSKDGSLKGPEEIEGDKKLSHKEIIERLNNKPDILDYTKYFKPGGEKMDGVAEILRDAKEEADKTGLSEDELAQREHDAEGVDLAEMEGPQDDEPYSEEEDRDQTLEYEDYKLNGAMKEAIADDKPPYEIEPSDWELTCGNYEKISLIWYQFDQIVANEEGETVDEHLLIGDIISETGFDDNDADVLYVRNDKIQADFEITKVYEAYGAT